MQTQLPGNLDAAQLADVRRQMLIDARIRNGLNWFYWIAGLSLVNSLAYLLGVKFTVVVGLGITQIVDGVVAGLIKHFGPDMVFLRIAGLVINMCIAGVFVLIGFFGRKGIRWPIIVGMVLYVLDGLLVLVFGDYLAAAFHLLALYGIWTGLKAMGEKQAQAQSVQTVGMNVP